MWVGRWVVNGGFGGLLDWLSSGLGVRVAIRAMSTASWLNMRRTYESLRMLATCLLPPPISLTSSPSSAWNTSSAASNAYRKRPSLRRWVRQKKSAPARMSRVVEMKGRRKVV